MASILDLFPSSTNEVTKEGIKEKSKPGINLIELLKGLFQGSPKKTGPGYDQPMGQPKGVQGGVPNVLAAEAPKDPLEGYNRDRGLPQKEIVNLILQASQETNVPPSLIAAILFNESGFNPKAINSNAPGNLDRGIAQINTVAHPEVTDSQAFDPTFAIPFLAKKLKADIEHFGGDINKGIQAYNVGRGGATQEGMRGKMYLDRVYQNLNPDYAEKIGIKKPF